MCVCLLTIEFLKQRNDDVSCFRTGPLGLGLTGDQPGRLVLITSSAGLKDAVVIRVQWCGPGFELKYFIISLFVII